MEPTARSPAAAFRVTLLLFGSRRAVAKSISAGPRGAQVGTPARAMVGTARSSNCSNWSVLALGLRGPDCPREETGYRNRGNWKVERITLLLRGRRQAE